jgi:hypothetical protein
MKNVNDLCKDVLSKIVRQNKGKEALEQIKTYFHNNVWPLSLDKQSFLKAIDFLIKGELPFNPSDVVITILTGEKKVPILLSVNQKQFLKEVSDIILKAKVEKCSHKRLGIAPFRYGGGFTRDISLPEIICLSCGLNVTLWESQNKTMKDLGIQITKKNLQKIQDWAMACQRNQKTKRILSANIILENPIDAYKKSEWKWQEKIPLTIVNIKKFESFSGR